MQEADWAKRAGVLLTGVLTAALLVACSHSSQSDSPEKAGDQTVQSPQALDASTTSAVSLRSGYSKAIDKMGTPAASWTDSQLLKYSQYLNHLESAEGEVVASAGLQAFRVEDANIIKFIDQRRGLVQSLLAKRVQSRTMVENAKVLQSLQMEFLKFIRAEQVAGAPDVSWSETDLRNFIARYDDEIPSLENQMIILQQFDSQVQNLDQLKTDVQKELQVLNEMRSFGRKVLFTKQLSEHASHAPTQMPNEGQSDNGVNPDGSISI